MKIRLLNWSGHGNLGDDAMQELLEMHLNDLGYVFVDKHEDWTIFGGGTLISPHSEFYDLIHEPHKTIGISIGVSKDWKGQGVDVLSKMKAVYARDYYSYYKLREYSIDARLSVDLWCLLAQEIPSKPRTKRMANIIHPMMSIEPCTLDREREAVEYAIREGFEFFGMSAREDNFYTNIHQRDLLVFHNAATLLDELELCSEVIVTRLHAHVAAWIAGVPIVHKVFYDEKINHFYERIQFITPLEAKEIMIGHLNEINAIISK